MNDNRFSIKSSAQSSRNFEDFEDTMSSTGSWVAERKSYLDYTSLPQTPWTTTPCRTGARPWTAPTTDTVGYPWIPVVSRPRTGRDLRQDLLKRYITQYDEEVGWNLPSLSTDQSGLYSVRWNKSHYQGNNGRVMAPPRIREATELKIVSHLRRKLNKRMETRIEKLIDQIETEKYQTANHSKHDRPSANQRSHEWQPTVSHSTKTSVTVKDPRDNYTDLGLRVDVLDNHTSAMEDTHEHAVLPGILSKKGSSRKRKDHRSVTMATTITPPSRPGSRHSRSTDADFTPAVDCPDGGGFSSDDSDKDEDFRYVDASPVTTPLIYRPRTREDSRLTKMSYEQKVEAIIEGSLLIRPPSHNRIVRIYIGSAFGDSEPERGYLMQMMYREAKSYCQQRGWELQIYDLHWGVTEWMSDQHTGTDVAMKLLEMCLDGERTPGFVTFISQKYGPAILPSVIPQSEFELISNIISQRTTRNNIKSRASSSKRSSISLQDDQDQEDHLDVTEKQNDVQRTDLKVKDSTERITKNVYDPNLLRTWYVLDTNAVPPMYRLQNISSQYPDIVHNDPSRRTAAKAQWSTIQYKLIRMLQHAVTEVDDPLIEKHKYFCSVPDLEVEYALLQSETPTDQLIWLQRDIVDLDQHFKESLAKEYTDLLPVDPEREPDSTQRLNAVREKLHEKIPAENIHKYDVQWDQSGITTSSSDHVKYMNQLSQDFRRMITQRIDQASVDDRKRSGSKMIVYEEVAQHVGFCRERCKTFQGRKSELSIVKRYVKSKSRSPMILYGPSGSGKTSLMAKIAKDSHKWINSKRCSCVVRMIGISCESTNVRLLLRSLCQQISIIQGDDPADVPQDYRALINDLPHRLAKANAENQLIIVVDALNQLTDEYEGRELAWLPQQLPKHTKMIISTLPDDKYTVYPKLKSLFANENYFLEVAEMHESDAVIVLDHWLQQNGRTLSQFQYDKVLESFNKCPLPMYLKLAYDLSSEWTSYTSESNVRLQPDIKSSILVIFSKLESIHGEALVRRALGYITAAKNGVTENEMEDLLSLDDAVMDDIQKHTKLNHRRCPQIVWMRLRNDLKDYLVEGNSNGSHPLRWFQSQYQDAAEERYLCQKDKAPSYHKALAEYFLNIWVNGKPIGKSEKSVDRFVSKQETVSTRTDNGRIRKLYNIRKMKELPYNLIKASMYNELKNHCLFNFDWLLAKISALSMIEVLADFRLAIAIEPQDQDLKVLSHALFLSGNVLDNDPSQLATQIVGRIQDIITADVPKTKQDPLQYPFLHPLLRRVKNSHIPSFIPSATCLVAPNGTLFDLLSGHKHSITALAITSDGQKGVTSSKDNTLKIWNLDSGKVMKTISGVGKDVLMLRTAVKNTLVITSEKSQLRIWNMSNGHCLYKIDDFIDPAAITVAQNGSVLVAYFDGSFIMRSWKLTPEVKLLQEIDLESYSDSFHQDESITVSYNTNDDKVLSAFRNSSLGLVHNVTTGALIFELKTPSDGESVNIVATSRDYYILSCRSMQMKVHDMYQLQLYDNISGKFVRTVRGCQYDDCRGMIINQIGSHAIAICASEQTSTSSVVVWNLQTEEHKHLASHTAVSTMCACNDMRYVLTGSKDEASPRIWNLMKPSNQNVSKLTEKTGIKNVKIMASHSQYAIAESLQNGTVFVTNLKRGKFCGKVVMKERNLVGKQDIVIFRNEIAIILANRNVSTALEDNNQVFQTIYRYNLRTKKYENKIKDCFIYPSPRDDYRLLTEYRLMGLSENRSHFIFWNTDNGQILYRMKPNFRSIQRELRNVSSDMNTEITDRSVLERSSTALMTPWDRRTETKTARHRRKQADRDMEKQRLDDLKREKENAIKQFILSKDEKVIVASFYAHHICVFDVETQTHTGTLEDEYSMLFLYGASLTSNGSHLVITNYDERTKASYITLWDLKECKVQKRLKNEKNVCVMAINDSADRILIGKENSEMRVWDPKREKSLRKIHGYKGFKFDSGIDSRIYLLDNGARAAVFAGDISLWDLDKGEVIAVFNSDRRIQGFELGMNGELLVFGLRDSERIIALRLTKNERQNTNGEYEDVFDEGPPTTDDESDNDDNVNNSED